MSDGIEPPALHGIVLAGGRSRRMGRDKGALPDEGRPWAVRARELLGRFCSDVHVSVREAQRVDAPYADLPLVVDDGRIAGPAAGLLAAWDLDPEAALLVLAVDLVRVDAAMLARLVAARDTAALATAFRHADGTPEPLCTIWEPAARAALPAPAEGGGISLRRVLETEHVRLVDAAEPEQLASFNSPDELERAGRAGSATPRS